MCECPYRGVDNDHSGIKSMSQWTKWLGTRSCDKFLVKLAAFPLQLLQVQRKIINSSFNIFLPSDGVAVSILMPKKQLDKELLFQKSFRRWRPMPNVKVIISIRWTIAKGKKLLGDLFLMLSQQFFSIQFCHRILGSTVFLFVFRRLHFWEHCSTLKKPIFTIWNTLGCHFILCLSWEKTFQVWL